MRCADAATINERAGQWHARLSRQRRPPASARRAGPGNPNRRIDAGRLVRMTVRSRIEHRSCDLLPAQSPPQPGLQRPAAATVDPSALPTPRTFGMVRISSSTTHLSLFHLHRYGYPPTIPPATPLRARALFLLVLSRLTWFPTLTSSPSSLPGSFLATRSGRASRCYSCPSLRQLFRLLLHIRDSQSLL